MSGARYPEWLRRALYASAIETNLMEPTGAYRRTAISPAPFYRPWGVQFVWDLPYSAPVVARIGRRPDLAKGFVENMVEFAVGEGPDAAMIRRSVDVDGKQPFQDGTQAPLLVWLTRELHRLEPDLDFVRRVYPGLAAYTDWWQSPRRDVDGDGLSEYAGSTPTLVSYESGHDYSPERDLVMGEPSPQGPGGLVHEPFADVFLNSCLYVELDALAALAAEVDPGRVAEWSDRRDRLAARMREAMWDEEVGGYFPVIRRDLCATQPRVYHHTPALLMPLWAGFATQGEADRTIRTLRGDPTNYPYHDGQMRVRLGAGRYQGYQVVTDGLHPTRGDGPAAGGVELLPDGLVLRFGEDRGPAAAAFSRLEVAVDVVRTGAGGRVSVTITDGRGRRFVPLDAAVGEPGTFEGLVGGDPMESVGNRGWTAGLGEVRLRAEGCDVTELRIAYSRMDRGGLLSRYGIKSAHPLDGKHPAPGAPTEFWSGTIWGPHQLHGCQALARYGYEDLARAIAMAYCDTAATSYAANGAAFEHYSHEDGGGLGTADYTWGAGVALLLMEEFLDGES